MNLEADWPGADVVFGVHHLRWIVSFDEDAPSFFVGKLSSPQNRSTWVKYTQLINALIMSKC